jgi:hypothetical protein
MAYPTKTFYAAGLTSKLEASPGAGGSLSVSTDGLQLTLEGGRALPVEYEEGFSGERGYELAARSPLPQLTPGARFLSGIELPFSWKGYGSAYSSSNKSPLHNWLLAAGWDLAFSGGAGAEKWTATPWAGGTPSTLLGALYTGSEKWPFTYGMTAYRWVCEQGKPGMDFFKLWALLGDPVDDIGGAEALTITYPLLTVDPPKADGMVVSLGSFVTPDVIRAEFESGWEDPTPRQLVSTSGFHAGWARGVRFEPRLRLWLEKTAFVNSPYHTSAGFDPYNLRKTAQKITGSTVSVQRGSTQYNRLKTILANAQVAAPIRQEAVGSISCVVLELRPYASTPVANDAVSLVMD